MDKLQWFKFTPTDWVMGKIQRCPEITQARFMRLICLYWNKECILSYEDAEIEIDKEHLDILINKKIIKHDNDFICIDFLNEQFKEIECSKEDKSTSAKIGNLKRWHKPIYDRFIKNEFNLEQALLLAYQSQPDSDTIAEQSQAIAEKSREELEKEKKRKEKIVVNKFTPPSQIEVVDYFNRNGYSNESAIKAFVYYETGNWKDGKGNQVKNWKQKMQSVWFKEDNKIKSVSAKNNQMNFSNPII